MKSKSKDKNQVLLSSALILLIAGVICKFIGAFYRIPLSNILSAEGIGVYQLVFPVYSMFLIICSGGIPVALSKIVAECRARNEMKRARRFLKISFFVMLIISTLFSVFFLIFNKSIAYLQGNNQAYLGYYAIGIAIVFSSVLTAFRGYFQGFQKMFPTAISQIIEQVGKLILGLVLANYLIKFGITFGVFGALLGIAISEFFAFVFLFIRYLISNRNKDILESEINIPLKKDIAYLIKKSFPITLNSLILPFILALDSFLVVRLLINSGYAETSATELFGVFSGMVNSLINFPTVVSLAISVAIIPAIAYQKEKGVNSTSAITTSLKISLLISLPCVLVYILFSKNIISLLYPNATNFENLKVATLLLQLSSVNIFFISILQITTSSLQAVNKSYVSLINLAIAGVLKIVLNIFLITSTLNIYGACFASIMCYALSAGLNYISLKEVFKFKINFKTIYSLFISSFLTVALIFSAKFLLSLFMLENISFIIAMFLGIMFYILMIFMLPIFTDEEIKHIPFGNKVKLFGKTLAIKK